MYDPNAFGNPDGSRTEIADMMSEFVVFEKKYFSSGVASPDDLKTRVIVGAKGAGKTKWVTGITPPTPPQSGWCRRTSSSPLKRASGPGSDRSTGSRPRRWRRRRDCRFPDTGL